MTPDDLAADEGAPIGYTRVRRIGDGASSTVYEALRIASGRHVALKLWRAPLDPAARDRFFRETDLLHDLAGHPNVVALVEAAAPLDGPAWLATELCDRSLAEELARGPVPQDRAFRIADGLLAGLAAVHDAGVLHRDVKPENVLLVGDTAKLCDLGISTPAGRTAAPAGTDAFLAPELAASGPSVRSDVYAAALTIARLFGADDAPPPVADVLSRASSAQPAERPASAAALRAALRTVRRELLGPDDVPPADAGWLPAGASPVASPGGSRNASTADAAGTHPAADLPGSAADAPSPASDVWSGQTRLPAHAPPVPAATVRRAPRRTAPLAAAAVAVVAVLAAAAFVVTHRPGGAAASADPATVSPAAAVSPSAPTPVPPAGTATSALPTVSVTASSTPGAAPSGTASTAPSRTSTSTGTKPPVVKPSGRITAAPARAGTCAVFTGTATVPRGMTLVLAKRNLDGPPTLYAELVTGWDDPAALSSWRAVQYFADAAGQRFRLYLMAVPLADARAAHAAFVATKDNVPTNRLADVGTTLAVSAPMLETGVEASC